MTVDRGDRILRRQAGDRAAACRPLAAVGLQYLRLGQPVTTLSGGEAQRLKLAGQLARTERRAQPPAARRADDRPALSRHRRAARRLPRAARPGPLAGRRRAQPRRDLVRGLGDRSRPGSRRGRAAGSWRPARRARSQPRAARTPARRCRRIARRCATDRARRAGRLRRRRRRRHRRRQLDPRASRARAQPAQHRRRHPARQAQRDHRRQRQRQEHARLRRAVRRRPAPLSRIAERLRPAVRAAGGPARRGRDLRHPADGRDRAAHQPRRPEEHRRHDDRDLSFPAPAVRAPRHAVLPRLRRPHRPAEPGSDPRAHHARPARQERAGAGAARDRAQGLLHRARPLGRAARLRRTARGRRDDADGALAAARPLHRARHRVAASARSRVEPKTEGAHPRTAARRGSSSARAACRSSRPGAGPPMLFSIRRACPGCGRSFPELDPRLFSFNSRHGWCPELLRHRASRCRASTPNRAAKRAAWSQAGDGRVRSLPGLRGPPAAARGTGSPLPRTAASRTLTALSVDAALRFFRRAEARGPRGGASRAMPCAEIGSRLRLPRAGGPRLSSRSTAPPRRSPAAKPSASGSRPSSARTCAASATSSTSRPSACTRGTTGGCSTRSRGCATTATPCSSSSTTRTRSAQADHVVDLGPGAGAAGGEVVAAGSRRRPHRRAAAR